MFTKLLTAIAMLSASQAALAAIWTLEDHEIAISGNDVSLQLSGSSTNTCLPQTSSIERTGTSIVVTLTPIAPGVGCFSSFRPWQYTVGVYDLPNGAYDVDVREGATSIGDFSFDMVATPEAAFDRAFAPAEGMWWSSDQPGTGMAFNIDDLGRWFAALYIYTEDGDPTFLTMQGTALSFNLDASAVEYYATGFSPLIYSEGGQCLTCPWSQASVSASGNDARLEFLTRNRAILSVGDWEMELSPMSLTHADADKAALPLLDRHYAMTIDGAQGRHALVVEGGPKVPDGFTGQTGATLKCVDCRTVDANGAASDAVDASIKTLIETQMRFDCNQTTCVLRIGNVTTTPFISKSGDVIMALATDAAAPGSQPTRIELRLLPQAWRP